MKGAKPCKSLDLFSVREDYLEDIVTDLATIPSKILNWDKPPELGNNSWNGQFTTGNCEQS
jgi:hypothetical protein